MEDDTSDRRNSRKKVESEQSSPVQNSTDLHLMGKRRFMSSLASLGISATGVTLLSQEALADLTDDPEENVPRIKYVREGDPVQNEDKADADFYTIPRDEWVYTQSRYRAGRQLINRLNAERVDPEGVDIVVTTKDSERVVSVQINNEKRRKELSEDIDVTESVVQYVPDQISVKLEYGIEDSTKTITEQREVPVIIEEESGFAETDMLEGGEISPDYGGSYYRPLPGATQIEVAQVDDPDYDDNDDWGGCTGCIGVYDEDLEEDVYLTAAHCFDAGEGRVFGQPSRNFEAGESDKISYSSNPYFGTRMDAATVQLDDVDVTDEMSDGEGDTYSNPVEGYLHHDWIQDNEGEEGLSKLGIATGHVAGTISNVSASNDYFTTTADRDGGDSGGPHYHIDGDDPYPFYLAGLHRGATVTGNARGILFTSIMDEFNITFGDQSDD